MGEAVEMSKWENSKENVLPLREGRDPRVLAGVLSESDSVVMKHRKLDEQKAAFEEELKKKDADVVEVWKKYVQWAQQSYTTDAANTELIALLERCTKELSVDDRHANDIRYLKLWIVYADLRGNAADVFAFLRSRGIGLGHALFYEALAAHHEQFARYQEATKTFNEGIAKAAAPTDRLKRHFKQFLTRMAQRAKSGKLAQQPKQPAPVNDENADQGRAVLGILPTKGVDSVRAPERTPNGALRKAVAPLSDKKRETATSMLSGNQTAVGIFTDEEGKEPTTPSAKRRAVDLPTAAQVRKENVPTPSKWTGAAFPMKRKPQQQTADGDSSTAAAAAGAVSIDIFVDEECERAEKERRNTLGEIVGYKKALLEAIAGCEQQFEEARAIVAGTATAVSSAPADVVMEEATTTIPKERTEIDIGALRESHAPPCSPIANDRERTAIIHEITVSIATADHGVEPEPEQKPPLSQEDMAISSQTTTAAVAAAIPIAAASAADTTTVPKSEPTPAATVTATTKDESAQREHKVAAEPASSVAGDVNPFDPVFQSSVSGGALSWDAYIGGVISDRSAGSVPSRLLAEQPSPPLPSLGAVMELYKSQSRHMDESLALYYAAEAIGCVEASHRLGVVHGNVSIDTLFVRYGEPEEEWPEWEPTDSASANGSTWTGRGLSLCGFGATSIDAQSIGGRRALGDWPEQLRWAQEDSTKPWLWGIDYIGLCNVIHALAFEGEKLEWFTDDDTGRRKLAQPLRKTWKAAAVWGDVFDTLLNAPADAEVPLKRLRDAAEAYIAGDARRTKQIKTLVMRQQIMHMDDS